ncbi:MAG: YeeE/YedE family protein [Bacteroidetes bacterium]|nr:YeeE/YedE family protein [Bacteroidota bacterium]MCL6102343.1 YeeE/YedE family protein [Bacteroidota bacterium]
MIGPIISSGIISPAWDNLFAVLLGMGFGFALESSGFSSSRRIIGTFFGYDFVVVKVFFTAAIVSSVGLLYLSYFGLVDFSQLYIQPTFLTSAIVGGIIMGIGFSMGGFCPGTSLCAAAIGRLDGLVFFGGMFIGVFVFSEAFPLFENMYYSGSQGAKMINSSLGISPELFTFLLILVAVGIFAGASWIQKKVKKVEY